MEVQIANDLARIIGIRLLTEAEVARELAHSRVCKRVHRIQATDTVRARVIDQMGQQSLAQTAVLPVVCNRDGDLGAVSSRRFPRTDRRRSGAADHRCERRSRHRPCRARSRDRRGGEARRRSSVTTPARNKKCLLGCDSESRNAALRSNVVAPDRANQSASSVLQGLGPFVSRGRHLSLLVFIDLFVENRFALRLVSFQREQCADGVFDVFGDSDGRAAIRVLLAKAQRFPKRHAHSLEARQQALLRPCVERAANRDRHCIGVTVQHDSAYALQERPELARRRAPALGKPNYGVAAAQQSSVRSRSPPRDRDRGRLEEPDTRG